MRPASLPRLILAGIFGPLLWVLCVAFAVFIVEPTDEVLFGALVAVIAFLLAAIVLLALRRGRIHEEREYVDSA